MHFLFGWIRFWMYYCAKQGNERDQNLVKVHKNLSDSHVVLFFASVSVAHILNTALIPLAIVLVIGQYVFQKIECYNAFKRVEGVESFRKEIKEGVKGMSEAVVGLAANLIALKAAEIEIEIEKILNEFFGDYKQKNGQSNTYHSNNEYNNYNNYNHYSNTNNQYSNATNYNESKMVKDILKKYDLPEDADPAIFNKKFRRLLKEYHPDITPGKEKLFNEVREDLEFLRIYYAKNKSA